MKIGLVALPVVIGLVTVAAPNQIKEALRSSGVYDTFVDSVLDQSRVQATDANTKSLLADTGVRNSVNQSFTPKVLQNSTEQVVDGYFGWLGGETAEPIFRIDLTGARQNLTNNLQVYAEQKARTLPACTFQQLRQLPAQPDILTIPCLPPGIDIKAAAAQFGQDVIGSSDFLKDPVITNETLRSTNEQGGGFKGSPAPDVYQLLRLSPWILGGLLLCFGVGLIFLHDNHRKGLRSVAITLVGCAAFLLLGVLLYIFFFRSLIVSTPTIDNAVFQQALVGGLTHVADGLNRIIGIFSGAYLLTGLAILLVLRRTGTSTTVKK